MKKFFTTFSIFLFLFFTINTITTVAQPKTYTQGFYTMKDLNLYPNTIYHIDNHAPHADGILIILNSNKMIEQVIRIDHKPFTSSLDPLEYGYNFIIFGDVRLSFY